jgi:hypothetical protein
VWLPVDIALESAVVLGGAGLAARRSVSPRVAQVRPILRETAIMLVLYAAWIQAGSLPTQGLNRAFVRAESIWKWQRRLHLPNELTVQRWLTHVPATLRFANVYYIVAHVVPMGVYLVWMFFRHRDRFARWRNILGGSSLVCVFLQMYSVAPPRMFPQLGFIDSGQVYGPRVYDPTDASAAGQLAAMPSMHVLWAVLIGAAVMTSTKSRWRWLGFAHAVLTVYAVTVTGYHWLADAIVGGGLVGLGVLVARLVEAMRARRTASDRSVPRRSVNA